MAGENVLPITECPDMISETFAFQFSITEDFQNTYLFYCERDTVVDAVFAIIDTADNDSTVDVKRGVSGTSVLTTPLAMDTPDAIKTGSISTTENFVSAGTTLWMEVDGLNTAAGAILQLRLRTRIR